MTDPSGPDNDAEGPFPIDPHDLLRHAAAITDTLPGRSATDYRRAVSAVYYALLHALTLRAVALIAPDDAPRQRYERTRRFTHQGLRTVALWVSGAGRPSPGWEAVVADLRNNQTPVMVAEALLFLREERTSADYDHLERFTQDRARQAIAIAARAVEALAAPAFATEGGGMALARLLADMPAAP